MAKFNYKAMTHTNEIARGTLNAKDRTEALVLLREKNLRPIDLTQKMESKEVDISLFTGRVKVKDIAIFARQFYTMLNSGISIIQCLDILRQQFDNKRLREVINELYESVQKGSSLSDAMKQHRRVFPDLLINMIEAGEASGNIDNVLQRMADHYEKDTRLRHKIQGAMIYPIVLSVITTLVVVFLLTFVLPTFITMFTSSGVELPLPTRILLSVSDFLTNFWYVVFGLLFLAIYLIRRFNKTDSGKHFFDSIKLSLPIIKHVSIRIATARFARTLSTLLASGIPLLNAMEITARVVGNRVVEQTILNVREDVRKGFDLAGPIRRSKVFPPMVDSMIRIGEESGSLDDVLKRTADFYDEEVDMSIQKLTSMLEPLMIVVMALVVGSIVIAIASPMFKMFETIS